MEFNPIFLSFSSLDKLKCIGRPYKYAIAIVNSGLRVGMEASFVPEGELSDSISAVILSLFLTLSLSQHLTPDKYPEKARLLIPGFGRIIPKDPWRPHRFPVAS